MKVKKLRKPQLFAGLMSLFFVSIAVADNAEIMVSCKGPLVEQTITNHGTSASGKGQGTSPNFQINVYSAPNPPGSVVFLGVRDPVICVAKINRDFRITGGRATRDPNAVYTDYNKQSSSRPPKDLLLSHVTLSAGPPQTDSMTFTMTVPDDQYKGTFAVSFTIDYVAVN